jgi:serine/threonine protein kinase
VIRCLGITKSPGDDVEITNWLKDKKDSNRPKPNSYMMVMVWANDGNLFDYIKNRVYDKKFSWYKRLEILEAISNALEIIHSKELVHQDLHCGNILMDDKDKFQFPVISDLGLCGNYNQTRVLIGVLSFIAPEHLRKDSGLFTTASDIYSFGIIMWIICCCKLPYEMNDKRLLQLRIIQGLRPKIQNDIPKIYADLMKRCWDDDPEKRPKAFELRNIFLKWKRQCHSNDNEFFIAETERLYKINNPDIVSEMENEFDSFDNVIEIQEMERSKLINRKSKTYLFYHCIKFLNYY